jgi:hypothetical protein
MAHYLKKGEFSTEIESERFRGAARYLPMSRRHPARGH